MFEVTPLRSESLGQRLASDLRRRIITGEVAPGTRLIEEDLAETFQVSRGPVRDAVSILRAEGLVTGSGRNSATASLTAADIGELMALRESFEFLAVEQAIASNLDALTADLSAALRDMDAAAGAADADSFTAADIRFHSAFFSAAGLTRVNVLWNQFRPTIEGLLHASGKQLDDLAPSAREHHDIADLIRAGLVEQVKAGLHRHLDNTRTRLQAAVNSRTPQTPQPATTA